MVGRKGHEEKQTKNGINISEEVSPGKDLSLARVEDGFAGSGEQKKRKSRKHGTIHDVNVNRNELEKKEKKEKKRKSEQRNKEIESQKFRKKDKLSSDNGEVRGVKEDLENAAGLGDNTGLQKNDEMDTATNFVSKAGKDRKKYHKEKNNYHKTDTEISVNKGEKMPEGILGPDKNGITKIYSEEEKDLKKRKKKKEKKQKVVEVIKSNIEKGGNGKEHFVEFIMDKVDPTKDRMDKKKKHNDLEASSPEIIAKTPGNHSSEMAVSGGNKDSSKCKVSKGRVEVDSFSAGGGEKDEKKRKKRKREKDGGDVVMNKESDGGDLGNEGDHLDGNAIEGVDQSLKAGKKLNRKRKLDVDSEAAESRNKVEKKHKFVKNGSERAETEGVAKTKESSKTTDTSRKSMTKGTPKKVTFAEDVVVFPSLDSTVQDDGLVRGKRFSEKEDQLIKEAVTSYIDAHCLGEEGIHMVLHCAKYPEVKKCWKEIAAALPWRPQESVYHRAHVLFERADKRSWTADEYEIVRRFQEKHGSDWRMLADALQKHRFHVKDAWRRIKLPKQKKGRWSQEEYQAFFDLVNKDLRMKAFEEKKSKHGMLRDNISWTAISDTLETRTNSICCRKWYNQLTSPMVARGHWLDTDDYRLLIALSDSEACCMEDVDWDNLLEHRPGDVCRKRWNEMVKHLGEHMNKSFADQVDVLMDRYCPDVLESREAYESKPVVP